MDRLGHRTARRELTRSYSGDVPPDELLLVLVFLWFGVHVSFPRGSQVSRFAGVILAATFLEMVVWYATHEGAHP